ncbi:hypothetical protein XENTR_v10010076 [Xenopus tropicalis]|uniref:Nuclear factor interleukin-3-regulated protein n=1 Tax=Xenopus tropicalis TaxID=8364 RepID=A0A6I8SE84_XENTR|nr:uncharacterized protein LOC100486093 [Xenopus tropicalis]XP_031755302.1 uncharacterized protein LOC100486093 [Xenopus tropicalis]KAE8620035.1 hypothetical protein XENTR_v10010076 [Xenopus tropicalis]|eukprot:XP_012808644.1 PREDICTED: uncharacterized protein LOC100486093 [Xenopus tropicalis]
MESPLLAYPQDEEEQRERFCSSSGGGRRKREFISDEKKDACYWEKRRKNNEAAKRSREKRRFHDLVLEGRVQALDEENGRLRSELLQLKLRFGLISATSFLETGQGLGSRSNSDSETCGGGNGSFSAYLGMNSDSSEADSGGGAALDGYSPRGSISDLSDHSSRDSPGPVTYGDERSTDTEFAHLCPSKNPSAEILAAQRSGVILYRVGGLTVDPQQRQRKDSELPSFATLTSMEGKCSPSQIRPPIFAHTDPTPSHHLVKAGEVGITEGLHSPKSVASEYQSEESGSEEGVIAYCPPECPPHQDSSPGVKLPHKLRLKCRPHGQETWGVERGHALEGMEALAVDA